MKKFLSLFAAAAMLVSCSGLGPEKPGEEPGAEEHEIDVTVLIGKETGDVITGSVSVTFYPSGVVKTLPLKDAVHKANRENYAMVDAEMKSLFGEEKMNQYWNNMVSLTVTLKGEPGDESLKIGKNIMPKEGLSLEATDSYDVAMAILYKTASQQSHTLVSARGVFGDKFALWCETRNKLTNTVVF